MRRPGGWCTQHQHPVIYVSASQDGESKEDTGGPVPPSSSSEIVLFVKFIHPQSLPITKVRDCGCGLQAEEGREGGTRRIWIQDVITQLSKPALKVKKKKKVPEPKSQQRIKWCGQRDISGEPLMAVFLIQCCFWHPVLQSEFELLGSQG